jgi:hypothetical protein
METPEKGLIGPAIPFVFSHFRECLSESMRRIGPEYIRLPTVAGSKLRERVFCYELYHQLRCVIPEAVPYSLHGEVDKGGHPVFKELSRFNVIPDFLLHRPGNMEDNFVAMEVKSTSFTRRGLLKDLATLTFLRLDANYQNALLLIYGGTTRTLGRVVDFAKDATEDDRGRAIYPEVIELAFHRLETGQVQFLPLAEVLM